VPATVIGIFHAIVAFIVRRTAVIRCKTYPTTLSIILDNRVYVSALAMGSHSTAQLLPTALLQDTNNTVVNAKGNQIFEAILNRNHRIQGRGAVPCSEPVFKPSY
jgi:hypothetical protein